MDKIIEFNPNYFNSLNMKIDWERFFKCGTCDLKDTTNDLENEVMSYFCVMILKEFILLMKKNKAMVLNEV